MENERKDFWSWVNNHGAELIMAGIGITTVAAVVWKKDELLRLWKALKPTTKQALPTMKKAANARVAVAKAPVVEVAPALQIIENNAAPLDQVDVGEHVRNLHTGWKASAAKLAEAKAKGIILLPGQTLVDAYSKGVLAA